MAEQTGECWFEPELYRLKGELLLRQCPDEEDRAEAAFRLAIERAAEHSALLWELRATISLTNCLSCATAPVRHMMHWHRSITGSPRGSTGLTCVRQSRCLQALGLEFVHLPEPVYPATGLPDQE